MNIKKYVQNRFGIIGQLIINNKNIISNKQEKTNDINLFDWSIDR